MFSLENGNLRPLSCPNTNTRSAETSSTAAVLLWECERRSHCQQTAQGVTMNAAVLPSLMPSPSECAWLISSFLYSVSLDIIIVSGKNSLSFWPVTICCHSLKPVTQPCDWKSSCQVQNLLLFIVHMSNNVQLSTAPLVSCLIIQISNKQGTKCHLISSVKDK